MEIKEIIKQSEEIADQIDSKKRQESQILGRLEENKATLKNTFGLDSVEEAKKEVESLKEKQTKNEEKIMKTWEDIQENYDLGE